MSDKKSETNRVGQYKKMAQELWDLVAKGRDSEGVALCKISNIYDLDRNQKTTLWDMYLDLTGTREPKAGIRTVPVGTGLAHANVRSTKSRMPGEEAESP